MQNRDQGSGDSLRRESGSQGMRPVILRRKPKNLGVLALFIVFFFASKPTFAATTSRLTIPVSSNATLVEQNENGTVSQTAIISDSLSSTKAILSSDGTTIETPNYYPYGTSLASQSYQTDQTYQSNPTNRYYTGQRKIPDDNLYNYNARYYSPDTGVFTQPDSVQGLNRFAYVSGNPIMNNDPTGHLMGPNRGNSDYPKDADPIKDIGTFIGVNLKTTGILDLASLAYRGYALQHGYGIQADDPIASYSRSLNHYISRADEANASAFAMVQPMSVAGDIERFATRSWYGSFMEDERYGVELDRATNGTNSTKTNFFRLYGENLSRRSTTAEGLADIVRSYKAKGHLQTPIEEADYVGQLVGWKMPYRDDLKFSADRMGAGNHTGILANVGGGVCRHNAMLCTKTMENLGWQSRLTFMGYTDSDAGHVINWVHRDGVNIFIDPSNYISAGIQGGALRIKDYLQFSPNAVDFYYWSNSERNLVKMMIGK